MIDHDAKPGPLERCQISGSENLVEVLDLGHQPLCDALLTHAQLDQPEMTFPLRLMFCPESGLAQLGYVAPGEQVYPADYPYKAGISWPVVHAHRAMAAELVRRFGPGFCVDVGCNDGTLLKELRELGCEVLGVEPTDVAQLAQRENGVVTLQRFFGEECSAAIRQGMGQAKLITMTNVFAHMAGLGEVMRGICTLLAKDGVFVTESHYLLDVLEKTQFDTVYHEHIRTYSLKALQLLAPQYGLEVFDVERPGRYGGNLRAYVGWAGRRPVAQAVGALRALEEARGLHSLEAWAAFRARALRARETFMAWLYRMQTSGFRVGGKSCPGRASTLINWYGIKPELVPYLAEIDGSLKIGKLSPGAHIPVVHEREMLRDPPDYLVLFAWHYGDQIIERLWREGVRSRFVVPLPEFTVVDGALQAAA